MSSIDDVNVTDVVYVCYTLLHEIYFTMRPGKLSFGFGQISNLNNPYGSEYVMLRTPLRCTRIVHKMGAVCPLL